MSSDSLALPMAEFHDPDLPASKPAVGARDAIWIAGIRAGDERVFDAMFEAHYARLCAFAATIVESDAVAEEVVQDTLLQIWQRRERWQVSTTVGAYLYRAVRNRAIGRVRHEAVERRLRDRMDAAVAIPALGTRPVTPEETLHGAELALAIERALGTLTPRCREAFLLRRQYDLSYIEIAEAMGITPKTVEVQIGTALRMLRAALRDWIP